MNSSIIIILKKERFATVVLYEWNEILRELRGEGEDPKFKGGSLLVSEMLIKNFKYDALNSTYIDTTSKTINGVLVIIGETVYMLMISACRMFHLNSGYIKFRYTEFFQHGRY